MYGKLTFIIASLIMLLASITTVQAQIDQAVNNALAVGDANKLVSLFNDQVDLTLLDQDDLFSREEAKALLTTFFEVNTPKSFQQLHTGESPTGLKYVIGKLSTSTGSYRVSFYYKSDGTNDQVQQLMIDNE